ncbi:MAG: AIR synthase related protein [Promethearchaeota archaeon]
MNSNTSNNLVENIIKRFQQARNIKEKLKINSLLQTIQENGYMNDKIYASIGEDAAAIQCNSSSEQLILLTTDALLPEFISKSPYGAGFSSIYLGIDDIMSCGGTPLACSTTVGYENAEIGKEIFRGILDATNRFKIPLVRGHTRTDSPSLSLTSTVIGTTTKTKFLSAGGSQQGDFLAIIWDPIGKPSAAGKQYWNTILEKSSEEFYHKRKFIKVAIENHYIHACKDISNGGILGTLYQMLEMAHKGANIELDLLNESLETEVLENFDYSLEEFLFLFLTSGFLISGNTETKKLLRDIVEKSGMRFYEFGTVNSSKSVTLKLGNEVKKLY